MAADKAPDSTAGRGGLPPGCTWVDDPTAEHLSDYFSLTDLALRRVVEPERGLYMAESEKVIRRAVASGHRMRSLLLTPRRVPEQTDLVSVARAHAAPVHVATPALSEQITGYNVHRGVLAAMHRPELPGLEQVLAGARRVAVLENIVDHTNVGAAFRSAAALGVDAVLVTPRCADPLYRRSVRVSMGTVFQVPWTRIDPWPEGVEVLQELGFTVAALALTDDSVSLEDLEREAPERVALVLGTEGEGLSPRTVRAADLVVRIPMGGGVDSLNVAAASAVAFWALRPRG